MCDTLDFTSFGNTLTTASYYDQVSGEIINVNMSNSGSVLGYSNGDLSIEDNATANLNFSSPVTVTLKHQIGSIWNYSSADTLSISISTGDFTIYDPNNDLNILTNNSGFLKFYGSVVFRRRTMAITTTTSSLQLTGTIFNQILESHLILH